MTVWPLLFAAPLGGLALLLAAPRLDVHWEHHPAHFWLVPGASAVSVALGALTSEAATRRGDAKIFLVSLAFLASAGSLGLHALATPGALVEHKNTGFVVATPVGLFLASLLVAGSALALAPFCSASPPRGSCSQRRWSRSHSPETGTHRGGSGTS